MSTASSVELLAPGGSVDAVKAAVLAGADAVYCGLPDFNARSRADAITPGQLQELVVIAHQHSCRVYLTLNTLVVDDEINRVLDLVATALAAQIDAVIVQDFGILTLLKTHFPALEIHASTQMTTHNSGQLALLAHAGVAQVNLCRELSLAEIEGLAPVAQRLGLKSEVFVYGAYCVSFSGQCYMSCAMSGKSGNRGECVQPCRRIYSYGKTDLQGSPLNLKDNSAFIHADELAGAGVSSFKIEGRIKGYKYVYATVTVWRRQIDRLNSGATMRTDDPALYSVFNRSLSAGYLDGTVGSDMFADSSRDQSLVSVGKIRSYTADTGIVKLEREVTIHPETPVLIYGEGFTFVCTGFLTAQVGRFSYQLKITHKLKGKISSGDMLYRQADFEGPSNLREMIDTLKVQKHPLQVHCRGSAGEPLSVEYSDAEQSVTVRSSVPLAHASSRPLNREVLEEKLGMLGETQYVVASLLCDDLEEGLFIPIRELNELRRRAVAQLDGKESVTQGSVSLVRVEKPAVSRSGKPASLALLTDNSDDFTLARQPGTKVLYELPVAHKNYEDHFVRIFNEYPEVIPWFQPILIGDNFKQAVALLEKCTFKSIITDNSGIGWEASRRGIAWVAGPMLNCTNSFALQAYRQFAHCSGAFISHELSRQQLCQVVAPAAFTRWYTVFAPLLLMNTRQCIIRNATNCSRTTVDEQCLKGCSRTAVLNDNRNTTFSVVKRQGFYNQLYNHRHYFNPAVVKDVDRDNAVFMVDFRAIPGKTGITCSRQELLAQFEGLVSGSVGAAALKEVLHHTTAAQYSRGI